MTKHKMKAVLQTRTLATLADWKVHGKSLLTGVSWTEPVRASPTILDWLASTTALVSRSPHDSGPTVV